MLAYIILLLALNAIDFLNAEKSDSVYGLSSCFDFEFDCETSEGVHKFAYKIVVHPTEGLSSITTEKFLCLAIPTSHYLRCAGFA